MFTFTLALAATISIVRAECSDTMFFEKNQLSQYIRYSRSRGYTKTSLPSLDFVNDLKKNGFGFYEFDRTIEKNEVLMLYSYKSSQGTHVYRICKSVNGVVAGAVGPIVRNSNMLGYYFQINDVVRFNKYLVDNNFMIYGENEDLIRKEIENDRRLERNERRREKREEWNKKTFIEKVWYFRWTLAFFILCSKICIR